MKCLPDNWTNGDLCKGLKEIGRKVSRGYDTTASLIKPIISVPSFSLSLSLALSAPFQPLAVSPLTLYQHPPLTSSLASACLSSVPLLSWPLCPHFGTLLVKITQLSFGVILQFHSLSCLCGELPLSSFSSLAKPSTLSHPTICWQMAQFLYFSEKTQLSWMYVIFSTPFLVIVWIPVHLCMFWLVISVSLFWTKANPFTWALDSIYLLLHGLSLLNSLSSGSFPQDSLVCLFYFFNSFFIIVFPF